MRVNKDVLSKFGLSMEQHGKTLYFSTSNSLFITPLIKNSLVQVDIHHRLTLANLFGPRFVLIEHRINRPNRQNNRSQTLFSERLDCQALFEYLHTGEPNADFDQIMELTLF